MRRCAVVVALTLLVVSCAGVTVHDGAASTSTSLAPSTTLITTTAPTPTSAGQASTIPLGPPVAWLAPSGVPLAVIALRGETVEVLTPCGEAATLSEGEPIYDVDVIIDPGHGGPVDTGAVAPTGLAEKEINLRVGLATARTLTEKGIATMLTRIADYPMPIGIRSDYSDMTGARALVSIHHNAPVAPASDIPGIEIFVQQDSTESMRLGGLLYDATMAALEHFDVDWDRAPDAGVMTVLNPEGLDAYGMVRRPDAPSALLELGYIANRAEAELYEHPDYVDAASQSIAIAVDSFLNSAETGASLVGGRVFRPNRGVGADQCVEPDLENPLYPDVIEASVTGGPASRSFTVTMGSPYDSAERYADAFRIVGDDGRVYGIRELIHDHTTEQPFTRSLGGVVIPGSVQTVTIEGRDLVYGWGGGTVELVLR